MAKKIGGNLNQSDTATESVVLCNSSTATDLLPALSDQDQPRLKVEVTNTGQRFAWIRKRSASVDSVKSGVRVGPNETIVFLNGDNTYRGAISAILDSGPNRNIIVSVI